MEFFFKKPAKNRKKALQHFAKAPKKTVQHTAITGISNNIEVDAQHCTKATIKQAKAAKSRSFLRNRQNIRPVRLVNFSTKPGVR
ncbi:hypothetical protein LJC48_04050 [Desulfovibrio sp. OttesenSCG-928-C06]|nr:hypothetical protein [Desulfovibrio sp. OttesenSCG-928-C06]